MDWQGIAEALRVARKRKGLSQRQLGERSGFPQSHISKIESGAVDLQVSSLVELARVLDMEVRLVPRQTVPAVDSVVRTAAPDIGSALQAQLKERLRRVGEAVDELTRLGLFPGGERVGEVARFLQRTGIPLQDCARVRKALDRLRPLETLPFNTEPPETLTKRLSDPLLQNAIGSAMRVLRNVRNAIVHNASHVHSTLHEGAAARAAYALDEEEDDG